MDPWNFLLTGRSDKVKVPDPDAGLLVLQEPYVPRPLQKALLREDGGTIRATSRGTGGLLGDLVAGNRLGVVPQPPSGALLCFPVGINGEALALTAVQLGGDGGEEEGVEDREGSAHDGGRASDQGRAAARSQPKVRHMRVTAVASSSIQQVAADLLTSSPFEQPRPLIAARTAYSLTMMGAQEVEAGMEGDPEWELQRGRTWTLRQPLVDCCWSSTARGQGAALTQDLRLWGFAAGEQEAQALERLWHGAAYLTDLPPRPPPSSHRAMLVGVSGGGSWGRACCQWGHHPRSVLVSTGRRLLSVDVRAGGGSGAALALWECEAGEGLLALATSQHLHQQQTAPARLLAEPFCAAVTTCQVLLFDLRRPHMPAASWDLPPTLVPPRVKRRHASVGQGPPLFVPHVGGEVLEEAAAARAQHMQQAQHALQLLALPEAWLSQPQQGSSTAAGQPGRGSRQLQDQQPWQEEQEGKWQREQQDGSLAGGSGERLEAEEQQPAPAPGEGSAADRGLGVHVGCVLHTDLDVGAGTAYCFHTQQGQRLRAKAPARGHRVGTLALERVQPPPEEGRADGPAAALGQDQQQQQQEFHSQSPAGLLPLTQASQAPPSWAQGLAAEGGSETSGLAKLVWAPAFMNSRVDASPPQQLADPLCHRPRWATVLAEARQQGVEQAQQAAHAAQQAQRGAEPPGVQAQGAGPGTVEPGNSERRPLAGAGSLGEGVPELQGAAAVWVPAERAAGPQLALFRLTSAGDILISQISPAPGSKAAPPTPAAGQRGTAPEPASTQPAALPDGAAPCPSLPAVPCRADPAWFEPPLLWPKAATQPAELLMGAAAAEAKLAAGVKPPAYRPEWQREGKDVIQLSLHMQLMKLRLKEASCHLTSAAPASAQRGLQQPADSREEPRADSTPTPALSSSRSSSSSATLSMLWDQLHSLAAPATLWELHSRATLAGPGERSAMPIQGPQKCEEAGQGRPTKRQRAAGPQRGQRAQQAGQAAVVPVIQAHKFHVADYDYAGRFPDPVAPFQRVATELRLLEQQPAAADVEARQPLGPAAGMSAPQTAGAAQQLATSQQGQQHSQRQRQQQQQQQVEGSCARDTHAGFQGVDGQAPGPRLALFPPAPWREAALSLGSPAAVPAGHASHELRLKPSAGPSSGSGSSSGGPQCWQGSVPLAALNSLTCGAGPGETAGITGMHEVTAIGAAAARESQQASLAPVQGDVGWARALGYGIVLAGQQLPLEKGRPRGQTSNDASASQALEHLKQLWKQELDQPRD
ncbi:hypothetical protein N2152v2_006303 [Parachlorella kessleri]